MKHNKHAAACAWAVLASLSVAQKPPDRSQHSEIEDIKNLASAAPPEFAADAFLRVVERSTGLAKHRKIELLLDASQRAGMARLRRKMKVSPGNADTRDGRLGLAYQLNLDSESLRLRAVRLLLPLDARLAREMFLLIERPAIGGFDCRSRLVYDPDAYYETLAALANSSFTENETARGLHIQFVLPYFQSLTSPVQVLPLARVALALKADRDELIPVAYAFNESLSAARADDRAFFDGYELMDVITRLAQLYERVGMRPEGLVISIRTYIAHSLSGKRCPDSAARLNAASTGPVMPPVASAFNAWSYRQQPHVTREVRPLTADDVTPSSIGDAIVDVPFWTTAKARGLLKDVRALTFKNRGDRYSLDERRLDEWRGRAQELMGRLDDWKEDDEKSDSAYFHEKCDIYETLVQLLPPGPDRERALNEYAAFLASSPLQHDSPAEWFLYARTLLGSVREQLRRDQASASEISTTESNILAVFEKTRSPVLSLYATTERIK